LRGDGPALRFSRPPLENLFREPVTGFGLRAVVAPVLPGANSQLTATRNRFVAALPRGRDIFSLPSKINGTFWAFA
jgi:hypothetical protein